MKPFITFISLMIVLFSCNGRTAHEVRPDVRADTLAADSLYRNSTSLPAPGSSIIHTGNVSPESLVAFSKTLVGVPYKYASADPAQGFDCSGFISYVFNHFNIEVPRSSVDFTNAGTPVQKEQSKAGDLILFTGTDTLETQVGHMGIITENTDSIRFIHSTSGKKYGVTITPLNEYYLKRFVKVIRVF